MKRILTLLLLASTSANYAKAQSNGLGLSRFGFSLGGDIDMPIVLDGDYVLSTAQLSTVSMTYPPV